MDKKVRKCPYCDSEISYLSALSEISGGEHTCSVCNKNSNIIHDKKIYIPAAILLAVAVIGAVITLIIGGRSHLLLAAVFIIIPSLIFFIITPFYYELYPIKSEAITPVVRHRVKSKKRSQITPRAIKYEEKKRLEKEKKNMSKRENSFRSKLSKFVNTYIIVDDDDVQDSNADNEIYEDQEKTRIAKALTDEQIEKIQKENLKLQENEKISDIDNIDPLSDEEESFSFVGSYTDRSAYERINSREPVYHSLNKITKVDFEYLPDYIDSIDIDLNEMEEEDKENEEILSFFDSDEIENLDVKKNKIFKSEISISESSEEKKTEEKFPSNELKNINKQSENVRRIEYSSEDKEEIEVELKENDGNFSADFIDKEINDAVKENSGDDLFDEVGTDDILQDIKSEDDYEDEMPYEQDLTDSNNKSKTFQEELDLSEYRTSNYVEDGSIDINIDDTEEDDEEFNFIEEQEVIFEEQEEEGYISEDEPVVQKAKTEVTLINKKKSAQKSVDSAKPVKKESEPQAQMSFFAKIKSKIILATEQERAEEFEREERERKLEDKEKRRKEKEKEKLRKERALKKENSSESKEKKASLETKNISSENRKKKQNDKGYDEQEKVVIDSVKDKISKMENKKISEEEKVKIIADKQNQEKKREQIEKLKIEQEKKRKEKEELRKAEKLKEERQKKAEQLRQKQAEKAKASQKKLKESTENRKTDNIKLTEINKVKTKVSQKQEQKRQELDKFFKD